MKPTTNQQSRFLYGLPFWNWLVYRIVWVAFAIGRMTLFRTRATGLDALPDKEPYLLLANHNSTLDPLWLAECLYRPVRPMGSAQMLKAPLLGPLLRTLGCFPKAKYTKDPKARAKLQELYDQGFIVLIFPEGTRSINGKTQPILPGIGRLIKEMKPKVVYAVSNSAFLFQPRWATYPRWVPIQVKFDGPYTYPEEMSVDELNAEVQAKIQNKPHLVEPLPRLWGWRMAHGLPDCIWACPSCLQNEGLTVAPHNSNAVQCTKCQAEWTIDLECNLTGTSETTVADAVDDIVAKLGQPPVMNKEDYDATGTALRAPQVELRLWPKGGKPVLQCAGEATLGREGLSVSGANGDTFHANVESMHAFSIELGNRFFFRSDDKVYEFRPGPESVYKWRHFLRKWKLELTGKEY